MFWSKIIIYFILNLMLNMIKTVHVRCRGEFYHLSNVKRSIIADCLVPWTTEYKEYNPVEYNSKVLLNKPWADPPLNDPNFNPKWNAMDGKINRKSHIGIYDVKDGSPLNPNGRTGIKGRGVLGKWGPNHAADPIVTRWKLGDNQEKVLDTESNKPILQFCGIQRKDCGEWAVPGGMVDPGEKISETLVREFMEEALNSLEASPEQRKRDEDMIKSFFSQGTEVYKGYVDDPRNTDNAWMETVAYNFHDEDRKHVGKFNLTAGDDAAKVRWLDIDRNLQLYASHSEFVQKVSECLEAHW